MQRIAVIFTCLYVADAQNMSARDNHYCLGRFWFAAGRNWRISRRSWKENVFAGHHHKYD